MGYSDSEYGPSVPVPDGNIWGNGDEDGEDDNIGTKGSANRESTSRSEQSNKQPPGSRFKNPFENDIDRAAILEDDHPFPVTLAEGTMHITEYDILVFKKILATWTTDDSLLTITPEQAARCLRKSLLKSKDLSEIFNRATTLRSPIVDSDDQAMDFIEFFVAIKLVQKSTGLDYRQLEERLKKASPNNRADKEKAEKEKKERKEKEEKEKAEKEKVEREKEEKKEREEREKAEREKKEKKEREEREKVERKKKEKKEREEREKAEREENEKKEREEREKVERAAQAERAAAEAARLRYVTPAPAAPMVERFTCCNDLYNGSMRCRCGRGGPTNFGRAVPAFLRR